MKPKLEGSLPTR